MLRVVGPSDDADDLASYVAHDIPDVALGNERWGRATLRSHRRGHSTVSESGFSPWIEAGDMSPGSDSIHLVDGTTFVVSSPSGVIDGPSSHGLFMLDTRVVSRWNLHVDDRPTEPLIHLAKSPFSGTFVARVLSPDEHDPPVAVVHHRHVGAGMHDDLEIRNHGPTRRFRIRLTVGTDLAGLFAVKAGESGGREIAGTATATGLLFGRNTEAPDIVDSVAIEASEPPEEVDEQQGTICWHPEIETGCSWTTCVEVVVGAAGSTIHPTHRCGEHVEETLPVERLRRWREESPSLVTGSEILDGAVATGLEDLGSLRIFDPDHADRFVVAAGAPWFMALFGRDSLLTSWMALPFGSRLALGVLDELADNQGTTYNPRSEEAPGRILHEVRFDPLSHDLLGDGGIYYGSVDATPLFVMLLAEVARWTGITDAVRGLVPAADRALAWVEQFGDRDGDGFVEYLRTDARGLQNQGWKDSWDGIRHADGTVATAPIALCEVQAYVYAAYRGRADLARALGDDDTAAAHESRAGELQRRFDEAFWLDDAGWYAVGLDEAKRPIGSLTSNIGHLLWSGIVPERRAGRLAALLVSPEMNSGWGLRTLASNATGYNPLSYHCGSVWPHDTALAIAGLSRHGFDDEAHQLATALLQASAAVPGSLPELFAGFARDDIATPVPYPTSCSPQAWAAAAPLLIVRSTLGLEPDVPNGRIRLRPRVAADVGTVSLRNVAIGSDRVDIAVSGGHVRVSGTDLCVDVS